MFQILVNFIKLPVCSPQLVLGSNLKGRGTFVSGSLTAQGSTNLPFPQAAPNHPALLERLAPRGLPRLCKPIMDEHLTVSPSLTQRNISPVLFLC